MSDQDHKLCDSCHERPGTNHICYGGDAGKSKSLCQVCLMQDLEVGGMMQRLQEAVQTGSCKYCSAPAETSFGASTSFLGDHYNLVCMICFNDLTEFVRRPENAVLDFETGDAVALRKTAMHLADMQKRQDEFIRQRVLQRGSK
jgi:hypothetical protein